MQTVQHMPDNAPDKSKTYALLNTDGSVADWFATHDAAVAAMRKTTQAGSRFSEQDHFFSMSPVGFEFAEGDGVWIEALEAKEYHTSAYGKIPVSLDKLNNLANSVKNNVRGIQLSTDYNHGQDAAKGSKASGTIKDAKVEGNKLHLKVAFTDTAKKEIADGEWKYFSSDWADTYTHEDGSKFTDVLIGGGLTNRPVAKGLNPLPINFSELYEETTQFAVLTSEQRNALPNSKFLYIDKNGNKHLPVPDQAHIRNAISRLSQPRTGTVAGESWLTEDLRKRLLAKARRMLNGKTMSEESMNELLKRLATQLGIQFSEDDSDDELGEKIFAETKKLNEEVKPLRELQDTAEGQKAFAEQYPEQYKQMQEDAEFRREYKSNQFAENIGKKRFSESVGKKDSDGNDVVVTTSKGLSALALDKIKEAHKKFSEGTGTTTDFSDAIDAIFDNGVVDYGEIGSASTGSGNVNDPIPGEDVVPSGDLATVRTAFAEKVTEIQTELQAKPENKDRVVQFSEAYGEAAKRYPKMHDAYMGAGSRSAA